MSKWGLRYAHKTDAFSASPVWQNDADQAVACLGRRYPVALDLGCGTGRMLARLGSRADRVIGVDPNVAGFDLCLRRNSDAELYSSLDAIADCSLNAVTCLHALPQMEDPYETLTALWEKMCPGADFVAVTHNRNFSRIRWPKDVLTGYKSDPTITTNFTLGSLVQLMRDTGFEVRVARRYGLGWARCIPLCAPRLLVHARRPL